MAVDYTCSKFAGSSRGSRLAVGIVTLWLGTGFQPGSAAADTHSSDHAVFVFGGAMVNEDMANSANLFGADYEDNFIAGGGYQNFLYSDRLGIQYGVEVGGAGRFGDSSSGELWGGLVLRHDGLAIADTLHFSPSMTVGLSAVTDTIGRETQNEIADSGDATFLFYLGPEISVSHSSARETEFFWRLHHRSGAGGTLGDMRGAANANVFGFRSRF